MTQGVLRMVTETDDLIVVWVNGLLRFRGKVGLQDQVEMVVATSPLATDTLTYIAANFEEVRTRGDMKIFKRVGRS